MVAAEQTRIDGDVDVIDRVVEKRDDEWACERRPSRVWEGSVLNGVRSMATCEPGVRCSVNDRGEEPVMSGPRASNWDVGGQYRRDPYLWAARSS